MDPNQHSIINDPCFSTHLETFENIKGVIINRNSKDNTMDKKTKQRSTKYYIENYKD